MTIGTGPDAAQILRRTCERVDGKRGKRTLKISDALTSLTFEEARAMELERLWRGHSPIENRNQYVRDVTMGEDRHQKLPVACQCLPGITG